MDFKPKRLPAYRVPEDLKASVNARIRCLLEHGIIKSSKSLMSSPVVCVINGQHPADGNIIREKMCICMNYQYVNKYTLPDAISLANVSEVILRVGRTNFTYLFHAKSSYHQLPVKPEDQWLTAFVGDLGFSEWIRIPFGMQSSGCTFVRAIRRILEPFRDFAQS